MISRDLSSQLQVPGVQLRFRSSAPERELVRQQVAAGRSPVEIERSRRVERRIEHLGVDASDAAGMVQRMKATDGRREAATGAWSRRPGLERIIDGDDLLSVAFLARGALAARSVCCIRAGSERIGTGFLVAPRLIITNAHVIASREEAADCTAEFGFEDAVDGEGTQQSAVFDLAPEEFFVVSSEDELDYALVAVKPTSNGRKLQDFGFLRLNAAVGKVLRGECLNIIQHPNAAPKRVALRQNRFAALLERFMHYETDTQPGSSGAPVFNDQWQVVCLHHSGVPLTDSAGNILTKDHRVWIDGTDDPALIKWIGNEGVRISRIVDDVAAQVGKTRPKILADFPEPANNPSHDEETLTKGQRKGATSANDTDRQTSSPRRILQSLRVGGSRGDQPPPVSTTAAGDPNSQSITIPLTLSLSLDGVEPRFSLAVADRRQATIAPHAPASSTSATLVERGMQNLERAQTRVYFDADQDAADRASYYESIDPEGGTLFEDLHDLLTETHATQLSYRVARIEHLYAWVDLQRDKRVRSIYSDELFDPARFIQEDFVLERRVEQRIEARRKREANFNEAARERLAAAFEAQEPFNCEHVLPQSWFENAAPMQGDLHHLFTCQHQCNSFRSNKPYHDFRKFAIGREALRPRCGFTEEGLFEPFMGKGKVARATLYFLIRYVHQFDNRYDELDDALHTLLDWHTRSEVTEHERHRNQAIFEIQGNRNPFIDHPEWAALAFEA